MTKRKPIKDLKEMAEFIKDARPDDVREDSKELVKDLIPIMGGARSFPIFEDEDVDFIFRVINDEMSKCVPKDILLKRLKDRLNTAISRYISSVDISTHSEPMETLGSLEVKEMTPGRSEMKAQIVKYISDEPKFPDIDTDVKEKFHREPIKKVEKKTKFLEAVDDGEI